MINTRSIATLGIGYSPYAISTLGFYIEQEWESLEEDSDYVVRPRPFQYSVISRSLSFITGTRPTEYNVCSKDFSNEVYPRIASFDVIPRTARFDIFKYATEFKVDSRNVSFSFGTRVTQFAIKAPKLNNQEKTPKRLSIIAN